MRTHARSLAAGLIAVVVGTAGAASAAALPQSAAPEAFAVTTSTLPASSAVLDLDFDGALTDASSYANPVSILTGAGTTGLERYTAGLAGQAFDFNGSTALSLGTGEHLQPEDLTLSFWFKPSADMGSGEQVITWNKTVYNSDGWYLSSENANAPLALSVGPSTGQPYKVSVRTPRAAFFPTNQWTHVAVTYDHTTKAVSFFRNGVRQASTIEYGISGSATGVLGSEATSVKSVGFNGPTYRGAYLRGAVDSYTLHDVVATTSDVVALYQEHVPAFDPVTVAQSDLAALSIPTTALTSVFSVPTVGASGSTITWTSSSPHITIVDGVATVTRPDVDPATAVLTASATYGGSAAVQRAFSVTVPSANATSIYLEEAGMDNVLLEDPYLTNANQQTVDYLLSLEPEKFLYSFYVQAGLTPPTPSGYGGWEAATGTRFQGHFFGHYLSALSQSYATATDPTTKAALLGKLTVAVEGLSEAQDAYALRDPLNAGYLSPFPVTYLPSGSNGLLVPFYNLHKIVAGLLDVHEFAPAALGADALGTAGDFGTWVTGWAGRQANPAALLNTEYGGMNEALYRLYSLTADPAHKRAAEYFDEVTLFRQLAAGQDVLDGKHANTTIPKLMGALKRYLVFTENPDLYATLTEAEKADLDMYRVAAENFFEIVVDHHTYANGGNSQSEHFHGPDELHQHATNGTTSGYGENSTSEGCNEYNMLKLARALFQVTKDVAYADYYESTYINTILASQNPETGMVTYFQPMTAGYSKIFGNPLNEFWCDHGTGIESFTKLGDSLYFTDAGAVYVNQFRSSVFTDDRHDLVLTQTADVPSDDTVTIEIDAAPGKTIKAGTVVKLRVPSWVADEPTLTVNGTASTIAAVDGYLAVPVTDGDVLSYTLPAEVRAVADTENPDWVAFAYGPVLLATPVSYANVGASYVAGVLVRMSTADKSVVDSMQVADTDAWKADIVENLVRIEDGEAPNGHPTMRFALNDVQGPAADLVFEPYYSLYDARYAIYLNLVEPDSPSAQAQILAEKVKLRDAETTVDLLTSFDNNNSEAGKNYTYAHSSVGVHLGQPYRDGQNRTDSFFAYDMTVDPDAPHNYLCVRYFGGDNGRRFDVRINGAPFKNETITNAAGSTSFYLQCDEIPRAQVEAATPKVDSTGAPVLDSEGNPIPVVNVRFQGTGQGYVGGVFGIYIRTSTSFDTDAELSALSFAEGTLTPALADGVHDYTVSVPTANEAVTLNASPATPSGLVRLGGVLIDDTLPRTVPLTGDTTTVTLRSIAQDHTTGQDYTVTIVREDVVPPISFVDVPPGVAFYDEISWLAAQGISTGWDLGDGTREYRPVSPVNRDAMAAFLYRLAGSPAYTAPATSPFTDVPTSNQFYKEISWLAAEGISTGWDLGGGQHEFRPLNPVNRDAMAAFLYRFADVTGYTPPTASAFSDVPTSNLFYKEISWLAEKEISTGWPQADGSKQYRPLTSVNRDAMAAFMYRLDHLS